MKMQSLVIAVMAALLFFSGSALAVKPPGAGNGGGGGGEVEIPDLGDLIILYRDARGVPYLTDDGCWQPLPSADCPDACFADGLVDGEPSGTDVLYVNPETCAIDLVVTLEDESLFNCATCTQEVDFGRINEARSSDSVFTSQLDDVIVRLGTADCSSLDPAGRLVTSFVTIGDEDERIVTSGAIDQGEKPAVPSAILKYHCTEMARKCANDAMDVHGGKGVMMGPNNYLGRGYMA
ncbi:MAG: acyl-CoA dehydrogenase family protein, partial [Desulfuromonadales bacterium]